MRLKSQNGAAAVEFALVLPLLVLLLFGIIEFSLLFYNKAMLTNASREGARTGIVYDYPARILDSRIKTVVKDYARAHLITFSSSKLEDVNIVITPEEAVRDSGDNLTVTVNYQYDFLVLPGIIVGLFNGGMGNNLPLQAVTLMRME